MLNTWDILIATAWHWNLFLVSGNKEKRNILDCNLSSESICIHTQRQIINGLKCNRKQYPYNKHVRKLCFVICDQSPNLPLKVKAHEESPPWMAQIKTYLKDLHPPGGNKGFWQCWHDLGYTNIKIKKEPKQNT